MGILSKPFDKGVKNASQKSALTVGRYIYNALARRSPANNVFTVMNAVKHMFGIEPIPKDSKKNNGSNYGFKKVILSDNLLNYPVIAKISFTELKTIGWNERRKNNLIIPSINISCLMVPIFTKRVVS